MYKKAALVFSKYRSEFLCIAILIGIELLYSSIYFNNTFPVSEGWNVNYVELMKQGMVPYRDFYYYLPPLNLLIDYVLWGLSFGSLFAYRIWWLLQRIIIIILFYRLLCRYFNKFTAFVATGFSIVLLTATVYDLFGDYNQTQALISLLLLYCVIHFHESESQKKKYICLLLAGVMLGLCFLVKQTIFAANGIVYLIAMVIYCIRLKDRNFIKYFLLVLAGLLIPIAIAVGCLACNRAVGEFIDQVYVRVGGKGESIAGILINAFTGLILRGWDWIAVALALIGIWFDRKADNRRFAVFSVIAVALLVIHIIIMFGDPLLEFVNANFEYLGMLILILLFVLAIAAVLFLFSKRKDQGAREKGLSCLSAAGLGLAAYIVVYLVNDSGIGYFTEIYRMTTVFSFISTDIYCLIVIANIIIIAANVRKISALFLIGCGSFALAYAGLMASGTDSMSHYSVMLAVPFVLTFALSVDFHKKLTKYIWNIFIITACAVMSLGVIASKYVDSYTWWGTETAQKDEKIYETDIPALKGYYFSADDKEMYEGIVDIIEENTDKDAVVFGYPYIKIFNILTERYNMDTFVPVLFYDVVDDYYVEKELELLRENLPEVVIWQTIEGCKEAHEELYRDGTPLKQREIEAFFEEKLETDYELVDTYGHGTVSVYVLND